MKKEQPKIDYLLLISVVSLVLTGIIALAGVSITLSWKNFQEPFYFLSHQILWGIIPGAILAFVALKTPITFFKKNSFIFFLITLFLSLLVFVPKIGLSFGGARRWLNLGIFSFQPSEFLKLSFILYFAAWLAKYQKEDKGWRTFLPLLIILGVLGLILILQPDMSTLIVIVSVALLMYFSSQPSLKQIILIVLLCLILGVILIKIAPYRFNRLFVFLHPETDPLGIGYQIKQALIAVGSGRILGLGLGLSNQKFGFLPQPMSDSVFAVFAEETGFIGSLTLVLLFLTFSFIGLKIANRCPNPFLRLSALGITSWIVLQAFINIGSMIGILPLTGIPLPFVSYGGSAIIAELTGIGVLLNISKYQEL
jgi:cell division protein FtsW